MKRYWVAILLVCVLTGLILYRAIPDSSVEPSVTDIGEIQLQFSALVSQKESSNVGSSIQESQTTTAFTSEVLATKPMETSPPTTAPAPTKPPATKPQATTAPATKPAETEPPATIAPVYSCGVEGHICFDEGAHNTLMEYIEKGCTHCGSSDCPCLLTICELGCTWPDYSKCPQYDEHKDPTVYCQDCGLIRSGSAESGQACCRKANKDATCSWCQNLRTAGECHQCIKP